MKHIGFSCVCHDLSRVVFYGTQQYHLLIFCYKYYAWMLMTWPHQTLQLHYRRKERVYFHEFNQFSSLKAASSVDTRKRPYYASPERQPTCGWVGGWLFYSCLNEHQNVSDFKHCVKTGRRSCADKIQISSVEEAEWTESPLCWGKDGAWRHSEEQRTRGRGDLKTGYRGHKAEGETCRIRLGGFKIKAEIYFLPL